MTNKVFFIFCAQALLIQFTSSQRLCRTALDAVGFGSPYSFGNRWGFDGLGGYEVAPLASLPVEPIGYLGAPMEFAPITTIPFPAPFAGFLGVPEMIFDSFVTATEDAPVVADAEPADMATDDAGEEAPVEDAAEAVEDAAPAEEAAPMSACPASRGYNIAPSANLAVVVMDSRIQSLFENLWNVR